MHPIENLWKRLCGDFLLEGGGGGSLPGQHLPNQLVLIHEAFPLVKAKHTEVIIFYLFWLAAKYEPVRAQTQESRGGREESLFC